MQQSGKEHAAGAQRRTVGGIVGDGNGFTFTFSFPASLSFCSLYSPSQGLTADGGAKQAHLQWGPEVMVSTV